MGGANSVGAGRSVPRLEPARSRHMFQHGPEVAPAPGETAIIVGGGPAGVHMAHLLREQGVKTIIVEKEHRIGGKSYTIVLDGVPHELGTCYLHPLYTITKGLLEKYGLKDSQIKPGGSHGGRDVYEFDTKWHKAAHYRTLEDWAFGEALEEWCQADIGKMPHQLGALPLLQAVRRYQLAHRKCFGDDFQGTLPPRPTPERWRLMSMTFKRWLAENGCNALIPVIVTGLSAQGYGLIDTMPAFYGLMWFSPGLFERFIASRVFPGSEPVLSMLSGGWSSLWQRIVEQDKLDVRYSHEVTQIERTSSGVTVRGRGPKGPFLFQGTHLFLACPFTAIAPTMTLRPEERAIFSELAPYCLCTTLYEMDPLPDRNEAIAYWTDALGPDSNVRRPGMLNCERWSAKSIYPDQPAPFFRPPESGNRFLAVSAEPDEQLLRGVAMSRAKQARCGYQFLNIGEGRVDGPLSPVDADALRDQLMEELRGQGVTGVRILRQKVWDYFFQFSQEALDRGLVWDLLAMQGSHRTFYIGSSACFESVNDVTNYNAVLVDYFYNPRTVHRQAPAAGGSYTVDASHVQDHSPLVPLSSAPARPAAAADTVNLSFAGTEHTLVERCTRCVIS